MDKELDRTPQEKLELVCRMEALTVREWNLEARASEIPELCAELASRRRTERRSEGHMPEAGLPAHLSHEIWWHLCVRTCDTHSATMITRNEQSAALVPSRAPPQASATASSTGAKSVTSRDGTVFKPAGPKEKKKDPDKDRVQREMYERQMGTTGVFKPGP